MALAPEKVADLRLKHLEMLQAVIARMSNQGASLKNYCITVTSALCGFAVTLKYPNLTLLTILPIASFALLDARYLLTERRFRSIFDRVRLEDWTTMPTLDLDLTKTPKESLHSAMLSWSITGFYGPLLLGVVIVRGLYGWFV